MNKERYIKPEIKMEVLESKVLCEYGSPNGGQGGTGAGGGLGGFSWKKNWH